MTKKKIQIPSTRVDDLMSFLAYHSPDPKADHLSDELFIGYSMETLSSDQLQQVIEHLESCETCAERMEALLVQSRAWSGEDGKERLDELREKLLPRFIYIFPPKYSSLTIHSIKMGDRIQNRYLVEAFIASGGMASIYRVKDLKRNIHLVMKILQADMVEDPLLIKRFQREARALQKLTHPNIVPSYGMIEGDGYFFFLEKYIDGSSLKDFLKCGDQLLSNEEILIILKSVTAALGYAHANGVVHCDIRPGNIMIDRGGYIYIKDFGIAHHSDSTAVTMTSVGTPAYMAPEQIRGESLNSETDIYALGILLFEMLTGQRPFNGEEMNTESAGATKAERIRFAHLHIDPPDPRSINPGIPEALSKVVLRCLAKKPSDRFHNVEELLEAACESMGLSPKQIPGRISLEKLSGTGSPLMVHLRPSSLDFFADVPLMVRKPSNGKPENPEDIPNNHLPSDELVYCSTCGALIIPGSKYCPMCGAPRPIG